MAMQVLLMVMACSLCLLPSVRAYGLTEEEITEILRAHNYYRGKVDPIATNMIKVEWNEGLAYSAQFWAATCEGELNEDRNDQAGEFGYIGQNIGAMPNYALNYTIMVQKWFNKGRKFNYYSGSCVDDDGEAQDDLELCMAYTQLVYAKTYAVGCGADVCEEINIRDEDEDQEYENGLYFVCYYGPGGGTYAGEPPYQTGNEVCSACPQDKPYCVQNLCADSGAPPVVTKISVAGLLLIIGAIASLL